MWPRAKAPAPCRKALLQDSHERRYRLDAQWSIARIQCISMSCVARLTVSCRAVGRKKVSRCQAPGRHRDTPGPATTPTFINITPILQQFSWIDHRKSLWCIAACHHPIPCLQRRRHNRVRDIDRASPSNHVRWRWWIHLSHHHIVDRISYLHTQTHTQTRS